MKNIIILILIAFFSTACAPKQVKQTPTITTTAPSWKAAAAITISTPLPKGHAIALPHAVNIKEYAWSKGPRKVLSTKALYWDGKSVRKVRFILFHNTPRFNMAPAIAKLYLNSSTPTLAYSCWTDHWPESMQRYAPWVQSGQNMLVDYGLPSTKYQGTTYRWYVLTPVGL